MDRGRRAEKATDKQLQKVPLARKNLAMDDHDAQSSERAFAHPRAGSLDGRKRFKQSRLSDQYCTD